MNPMFRTVSLERVQRTLLAVARRKALEEAERQGWPLPVELSVQLQLAEWGFGQPRGGSS